MPNRTQIVCLHEGKQGQSIDGVFINCVLKALDPAWLRPWKSNVVRLVPCGGRKSVIQTMPNELKACLKIGSDTTLIVWADLDDDMLDGDALKEKFWQEAKQENIDREDFDNVVFIFPKDRLENWIEFLNTNVTDEELEGPRLRNNNPAVLAALKLAERCKSNQPHNFPSSLEWSCRNWRALVKRMK